MKKSSLPNRRLVALSCIIFLSCLSLSFVLFLSFFLPSSSTCCQVVKKKKKNNNNNNTLDHSRVQHATLKFGKKFLETCLLLSQTEIANCLFSWLALFNSPSWKRGNNSETAAAAALSSTTTTTRGNKRNTREEKETMQCFLLHYILAPVSTTWSPS